VTATLPTTPVAVRPGTRSAGVLILVAIVLEVLAEIAHPHRVPPNDHAAAFAEYAGSTDWLWVHLVQFASAALFVAGFVALYHHLAAGGPSLLDRLALVAATGTLAAIMFDMAVDGVALKHAVDAWAAAAPADKAMRFDAAETVRWLEWSANAFFKILLGLTAAAFGASLLRARATRLHGLAGVVAGGLLVASGVQVGREGFTPSRLPLVWSLVLALLAVALVVRPALAVAARTAPGALPGA
jgi:hypothetical protein